MATGVYNNIQFMRSLGTDVLLVCSNVGSFAAMNGEVIPLVTDTAMVVAIMTMILAHKIMPICTAAIMLQYVSLFHGLATLSVM